MIKVTVFTDSPTIKVLKEKDIAEFVAAAAVKETEKEIEETFVKYESEEYTYEDKFEIDPSGEMENVEILRTKPSNIDGEEFIKRLKNYHPDAKLDGNDIKFTVVAPKKVNKVINQLVPTEVKKKITKQFLTFDGDILVELLNTKTGTSEFKKASDIVKG